MKHIEQRKCAEKDREVYKKLKRRCEDVEKTFQAWDNFFCNVKPTVSVTCITSLRVFVLLLYLLTNFL